MEANIHPGLPPAPGRLDPRDDLSVPKRKFAATFRRSAPGEAIRQVGEFESHARHVAGRPARKPRLLGAESMAEPCPASQASRLLRLASCIQQGPNR